jgi:hypothetical protein
LRTVCGMATIPDEAPGGAKKRNLQVKSIVGAFPTAAGPSG